MIDALDLLLNQVREPHPCDESFVQGVMTKVRFDDRKRGYRESLRRPIVVGIAAGVVVMGGAVAALVGGNPERTPVDKPDVTAGAPVTVRKATPTSEAPTTPRQEATAAKPAPAAGVVKKASGYLTEHTAWAFDAKTGLHLTTESYTTEFVAGKSHRVTLTLENTGAKPISVRAPSDCGLQAMAVPKGGDVGAAYTAPQSYQGRFEWVCAGSDADPRLAGLSEDFVLDPGDRRSADAFVTLQETGDWNVFGMCKCTYRRVDEPTPPPKSDPLTDLFRRTVPSDLLITPPSDGKDLATPPIGVRAR